MGTYKSEKEVFIQMEQREAGLFCVPGKPGTVHLPVLMRVHSLAMLVWTRLRW